MELENRLREFVTRYASEGNHRTGTCVDLFSASWLADELRKSGAGMANVRLRTFPMRRLTPLCAKLSVSVKDGNSWVAEGVPMYDCGEYTELAGVSGSLGFAGEDCDLAIVRYSDANEAAKNPGFMEARLSHRHKAVIALYHPGPDGIDGLPLVNAQDFPQGGVGKPALQLHSRHFKELAEFAKAHAQATLVAVMDEEQVESSNVEAEIQGTDPSLPPVLVLTPRSGWWGCAVERAASIASFIELVRAVAQCHPRRSVLFSANSGHELAHLGIHCFHKAWPGYAKAAHLCIHLGANWGSMHVKEDDPVAIVQFSDSPLEALAEKAFRKQGFARGRLKVMPASMRPVGEARELYDAGAQYLSIIGLGNKEFHMEEDTAECVNFPLLCKLTEVAKDIVVQIVSGKATDVGYVQEEVSETKRLKASKVDSAL